MEIQTQYTEDEREQRSALDVSIVNAETQARLIEITAGSYETGMEMIRLLRRLDKEIVAFFKPMKTSANKLHKDICATENDARNGGKAALKELNGKLDAYDDEQDRIAKEAAAKEAEEARKIAEQQAIEEAAALEEVGLVEDAERRLDMPLVAPPVAASLTPKVAPPKVDGMTKREEYDFEITNPNAIAKDFLKFTPDTVKIRAAVKQHEENAVKVVGPGIRVFKKRSRYEHGKGGAQ